MSAAAAPLINPLGAAVFVMCAAAAAALANCALLAALFKRHRNGLHCILTQIAISDIVIVATTIAPEVWCYTTNHWHLGLFGCKAYKGADTFLTTATLYLIATAALHSLAIVNVEEREALRRIKRSHHNDDEEIQSSRHSLVASSDSSTPPRTMNIDYRMASDAVISVTPPVTFVWILSASLSVPAFTLSSIREKDGIVTCSLPESNYLINMQLMLAVFNFIIPVLLFCVIIVLAITKLKSVKGLPEMQNGENVMAVKLSLCLIVLYSTFCLPRPIFAMYKAYSLLGNELPQPDRLISTLSLVFNVSYLISSLLRPFLCIFILPHLRRMFTRSDKSININNV